MVVVNVTMAVWRVREQSRGGGALPERTMWEGSCGTGSWGLPSWGGMVCPGRGKGQDPEC